MQVPAEKTPDEGDLWQVEEQEDCDGSNFARYHSVRYVRTVLIIIFYIWVKYQLQKFINVKKKLESKNVFVEQIITFQLSN